MRYFIGIVSGVIFLLLAAASFFLPLPMWILAGPAIAFVVGQGIAMYCPIAGRIFQFGDYIYYLVIGSVLGLGGMIIQNGTDFSSFLSQEARQSDERLFASLEIKVREIEASIDRNKTEVERVQSAYRNAIDRADKIDTLTYRECLNSQAKRDLERTLGHDRYDSLGRSRDPFRRFVEKLLPFECPAIEDLLAEKIRTSSALRGAKEETEQLEQELTDTLAFRDEVAGKISPDREGIQWPWGELSEGQRRFYLFQLFPCFLLMGIAIKIGKTTAGILSRDDQAGKQSKPSSS